MDANHLQEDWVFKRPSRASLVKGMLNGSPSSEVTALHSRFVTDVKPQESNTTDKIEASVEQQSPVEWNKGEVSDLTMTTTKEAQATMILPMRWMLVFTNFFMASLWRIGVCLAKWYQHWTDYNATQGPHLLFMRRARVRKPPDKSKGRPVGSDKSRDCMLANIIERESVQGTQRTLFDRLRRRKPTGSKWCFMLLALQVTSVIAMTQLNITITESKNLRNRLKWCKQNCQMIMGVISGEDQDRLQKGLGNVPLFRSLESKGGTLIIDAASRYIKQAGRTTGETIESKMQVDASTDFLKLGEKEQGIARSNVSAKFKDDTMAKNDIQGARTMMHCTQPASSNAPRGGLLTEMPKEAEPPSDPTKQQTPWIKNNAVSNKVNRCQIEGQEPLCHGGGETEVERVERVTGKARERADILEEQNRVQEGAEIDYQAPTLDPGPGSSQDGVFTPKRSRVYQCPVSLQDGVFTPKGSRVYQCLASLQDGVFTLRGSRVYQCPDSLQDGVFTPGRSGVYQCPVSSQDGVFTSEGSRMDQCLASLQDGVFTPRGSRVYQCPHSSQDGELKMPTVAPMDPIPPTAPHVVPITLRGSRAPQRATQTPPVPLATVQRGGKRFGSDDEFGKYYRAPRTRALASLCWKTAQCILVRCVTGQKVGYRYMLAILTDVDSGALEGLYPGINQYPNALKAAYGKDPDAPPTFTEAMNAGSDQEQYKEHVPELTEGWLNQQEFGK